MMNCFFVLVLNGSYEDMVAHINPLGERLKSVVHSEERHLKLVCCCLAKEKGFLPLSQSCLLDLTGQRNFGKRNLNSMIICACG